MIWKIFGSLFLLKYGLSLSQFLWMLMRLYFLPKFGLKKDLKKYGSWAVVTGATDGIGKAIAIELAKRGINIVLISRSEEKLKAVASEIESIGVMTKTIVYDFNDVGKYDELADELENLDIGILVNNVGVGYDHPEYFLEMSGENFDRMVKVNVTSVIKMTRIVLDGMAKRRRGLVIHVSSASGEYPIPFLSVYSASKAFVTFFGKALHQEYRKSGIHSQVISPLFVATNMSKMRPRGMLVPSANCYAKGAVNAFGLSSSMTGCLGHELQKSIQSLLPEKILNWQICGQMLNARKRWYRKQEQKKE